MVVLLFKIYRIFWHGKSVTLQDISISDALIRFYRYSDKLIITLDMYQYDIYLLVSDSFNKNEHFLNNYEYQWMML